MDVLKLLVDYGVIGFLIFLSFVSVGTAIERYIFIKRADISKYKSRQDIELELTKNMHWIATIGSNAPYIGLLGTVLGIMLTFYTIGQEGFVDTKKVMVGLALALKATAVGLLVAIPSTALYNVLLRRVREKLSMWEKVNGR
ncbi:MAG: TonB-system energizer ExbB [Hydrogenobacter thermophilus]|uniref:Biopolymer transport protein n=1 Tax=Hydrogenobacter thermophilus (strain DSM 6534 / IAM 12695 / TK-6) TaxID=608538 RepID=D3DJX3_HYDTT|nr:TonB-system energizer ExbB [Hydrogenobacter thermophilus]ADO46046.1 tonB-system energizer ExbB [Hydrogenobacter thermophilus TK-6]MCS7285086.1 TonB-system energizer ExbB [Hydrogenobacter thermophilus]BAI70125.1 biopolymer transport protein [Hydrogenobacter thermophilus TK-6]